MFNLGMLVSTAKLVHFVHGQKKILRGTLTQEGKVPPKALETSPQAQKPGHMGL